MKKLGDRRDGVRVKNINGLNAIIAHIKPNRCDSDVYIDQKIDVTELVKYVEKRNKDLKNKDDKITYFHAFSMAIAKVVYNRPLLNRFIANGRFYDRNNVSLSFMAKVAFEDYSKEFMSVLNVGEDWNIDTMQKTLSSQVKKVRSNSSGNTDSAINIIGKMPKFLRVIIVAIFKFLDRHDLIPASMTKDLLYYSTIIISNLGSIGCDAIYHNLTDFGTNSILMTIGKIHKENVVMSDGSTEIRDFCNFGITLDERIADGFYFVKSVQLFDYILQNPELLEGDANEKIENK